MISIGIVDNRTSVVVKSLSLDWAKLSKRLARCNTGEKDGPAWMPTDIDPGPRKTERVKSVVLLVFDVEAKAEMVEGEKRIIGPEPPSVDAMLAELILNNLRCIVHTSFSHTTEHPRYRVVFDLSRPMTGAEVRPLGLHVAATLGIGECIDTTCLEPARMFYLPRCPADRLALFHTADTQGEALDVDALFADAAGMNEAIQAPPKPRNPPQSGGESVINAFNAAHEVGAFLEQHGYKRFPRNRWLWPGSTSCIPGVRLLPDSNPQRVYSSHGGDPLSDRHGHDAFDLFRILQHGGDNSAAVKAAGQMIGTGWPRAMNAPRGTLQDFPVSLDAHHNHGDGSASDEPNRNQQKVEDGDVVFNDVHAFLGRFVAYPSKHAHIAHTLWIAHTHLMDAWDSTPRIAFLSPEPGSGKSRALEVSELLVPRPVESVNVTPAYLFRKVGAEEGRPTILYDEIDTVFGPKATDNEEIRGLLNAGHRKHSTAGRCVVRGKQVFTEEIPAYCAVALAGLGGLPDTMLTRSVVVRMRRRAPSEMVEPYRRREQRQAGEALAKRLEVWAASVESKVTGVWPTLPHGIHDRDADVWEALLACADAAEGTWPEAARVACVALVAESKASTPSLGIHLLSDLRKVFGDAEALSTEQILTKLIALDESPWGDLRGKPLDARGLSNRLRPYGVSPTSVRIGDSTPKGYYRQSFWDSWNRYLGPPPLESATTATSATEEPDVSVVADVSAARWEAHPDEADDMTPLDRSDYYRATRGE